MPALMETAKASMESPTPEAENDPETHPIPFRDIAPTDHAAEKTSVQQRIRWDGRGRKITVFPIGLFTDNFCFPPFRSINC